MRLAAEGRVTSVDGRRSRCRRRSICVHGDTPDAVGLARAVRDRLLEAGVALQAFA